MRPLEERPGCVGTARGSTVLDKVRGYVGLLVSFLIKHDVLGYIPNELIPPEVH